ncbi:MAG: rRNA pseudouridine synthase [Candidatus Hydrogenedentota bacterium]|nr:MAG: rRNA pseudouridine synthase [Candidatus Hydrogenedentota bacterium]
MARSRRRSREPKRPPEKRKRVNAFLAAALAIGRREADHLIAEGLVRLNGRLARFYDTVGPKDSVLLRGEPLARRDEVYLALNKPAGTVTARRDRYHKTVMELLPEELRIVKPVGRLDLPTRGLLVLTTDGAFAQRLLHPRHGIEKEYIVTLNRRPPLKILRSRIELEDGPAQFRKVEAVGRKGSPTFKVILFEGRKRQIRRMFSAWGYEVKDLIRVRIGRLRLGSLKEGCWRPIRPEDVLR